MVFREARPGDLSEISGLYAQLHPNDPPVTDEALFQQILQTPGLHLFALELDGIVLATTYLTIVPNLTRGAAPYAVIENVVVDRTHRGTGLGKQIMAETIQAAWDAGCYKVTLTTGSRNPNTHAFYRACGLATETKTAYHALNPGRPGEPLPHSS